MTHRKYMEMAQERDLEALRKVYKEINSSKESASEFLAKTGIYTKSGQLSKNYR